MYRRYFSEHGVLQFDLRFIITNEHHVWSSERKTAVM